MRQSFGEWCIKNNRNDILERWDYDLNDISPYDIGLNSTKEFFFKCPAGRHESEKKKIKPVSHTKHALLSCVKCNSFAQHVIDEYGEDYLNTIWFKSNGISHWEYRFKSNNPVQLVCEYNSDHIYEMAADHFMAGQRCPYCAKKQIYYLDSLGFLYPKSIDIWDNDLNKLTPYDYSPGSQYPAYWICEKHGSYQRYIQNSVRYNFICPKCALVKRQETPSPTFVDLVGQKFGTLTVKSYSHTGKNNKAYWICLCDCGNTVIKNGQGMRRGSITTCGDWSIHKSRENNSNWKGGVTPINALIRQSIEYKDWRLKVYQKDHFSCVLCGSKERIEAHHIYPFSRYENKRFDILNGITLCRVHHNQREPGSFHNEYGALTSPTQLEEYINNKRKELGINIPFSIDEYLKGNILNKYIDSNPETGICSISIPVDSQDAISA